MDCPLSTSPYKEMDGQNAELYHLQTDKNYQSSNYQ